MTGLEPKIRNKEERGCRKGGGEDTNILATRINSKIINKWMKI